MDRLEQIGAQLNEMITLSHDLLAMSDQHEPDLKGLEMGFQNRGKLLEAIQSGSNLIDWQNVLPVEKRDQILESFENLKEIDSKLRSHLDSLLNQKKSVLHEAQRSEIAGKRYRRKQRVDNALFIRNKLEG